MERILLLVGLAVSALSQVDTGVTARPDRTRDGSLPKDQRDPVMWYDINAFVAPAALTYGNSGRNVLRAPGRMNIDCGLARSFTLTERMSLQFRDEFFHLFSTHRSSDWRA